MKTILAWLDWSSNCCDYNYTFPKTLCSLFWKSFFNIILLPFTYVTHIWNIFLNKRYFREECSIDSKANMWTGILLHITIGLIGIVGAAITEKTLELDWFHSADFFLLNYIKLIGVGLITLIAFGIILGIVVGIVYGIYLIFKSKNNKEIKEIEEPGIIKKAYLAIKDKYCPIIDWSDIKKINL